MTNDLGYLGSVEQGLCIGIGGAGGSRGRLTLPCQIEGRFDVQGPNGLADRRVAVWDETCLTT